MNSVKRLLRAVRHLGFSHGIRYWRIESACIEQPSLATYWAERCEMESRQLQALGDYDSAYAFALWARDLRTRHEHYMQNIE